MINHQLLRETLAPEYEVERELGRGGMAIVFLARERKHDRAVAIKVLRPELSADLGAERFLREIRIAARLSHPNILPLLASGQAGPLLYYVMPFIEGDSLRARLDREGRLSVPAALRIATSSRRTSCSRATRPWSPTSASRRPSSRPARPG
jgi:serine/threonine-protein kinase